MPRIPTYDQQIVPQASLSVRSVDTGASDVLAAAGQIAQGLGHVAAVQQRIKEQDAAAAASVTLAKSQADWLQHLEERKLQAPEGAPEFAKTLLSDFDAYTGEALAKAGTRTSKAFLQTRLAEFRGQLGLDAVTFENESRASQRKSRIGQGVDAAATAAELNPNGWSQLLGEQLAVLSQMEMPPAERTAWAETARDTIQARAAVGAARRDPSGTLKRVVSPAANDTLFLTLSPKARDAVLQETEAQQRAAWSREDHAYTAAKRAESDMNDAAAKDGDRLLAGGQLTADWIERNRARLSPGDYRYLYRSLGGGEVAGARALETYADLRERASNGEDVRGDARIALQKAQIDKGDYDRLLNEVESSRPNWYKRGTQYLSQVSGYSDLNPDPGAAQTKANMLDDWAQWATDNPKATDAEARDSYNRIAHEYSLIDRQKITVGMRAPRYLVGSRNQPDIDQTERKTVEAFKRGDIDQAEFERQAALLQQWRNALNRGVTDAK